MLEPGKLVMEVKFTEFLPQVVRDLLPGKALRERMPHTFFLVPGYGAQGGTAPCWRMVWHMVCCSPFLPASGLR